MIPSGVESVQGMLSDSVFDRLSPQAPDSLLALIGAYRLDPRVEKIDVGVGVYRSDDGQTPVMEAVKIAEHRLAADQPTKAYLGPEGDIGFFELLKPVLFGAAGFGNRLSGLQTPGGTGALRLAAELIAAANPEARILVGTPTWPNHYPILAAARLQMIGYRYLDLESQAIDFDAMLQALEQAMPGDVVLLHGCCHNPTGADLDRDQWATVTRVIVQRNLLPLVDLAYQGLGDGLAPDVAGLRGMLGEVPEALIAYSCDKNFGLYRERTGALFALSKNGRAADITQSNLLALARANWSMPPDHGAAIVRIILQSDELTANWRAELERMCARVADIRQQLAAADPTLAALAGQKGMFSTLALSPDQMRRLREEHGVYLAPPGRINIAGLVPDLIPAFAAALAAVR